MLDYATTLKNPNFAALAESVGIKGIRVNSASTLMDDLHQAFAHEGPVIIDVAVHRNELIIPPTIAMEQVKGLSLYMMKAIINGQGDAVLDLMKTNLWRSE
jgi:pyruvate dehydrogenase (quinone)